MSPCRRFAVLCIALLLPGAALAQPLRLAVAHGSVSLPIYVAEVRGAFKAEGVAIESIACRSGRQCFEMLESGAADIATAAELLTVAASLKHAGLALFATISGSSHQIKLVARRSAGIEQPAQLVGKRIATAAGTSAEFFLDRWLDFHALEAADVTRVALAPDRLATALANREVDAVAIWEPIASAARAGLGADALLLPSARVYTQHFSLTAPRTLLHTRRAEVQGLLRALLRAQQVIAREPAQAKAVLRQRLAIDEATAEALLAEQDFRVRLDQSLISTMESQRRWLQREGMARATTARDNLLDAIEPGPLRAVAPQAVGLVR